MNHDSVRCVLLLSVFSVIAAISVFWSTRQGPGLSNMSAVYISVSRSFVSGRGLVCPITEYSDAKDYSPLTHWPPLYSMTLGLVSLVTGDAISASRWLNIFLFPLTILVSGWIIYRNTRSIGSAMAAAFLILFSSDLLIIHSLAQSESLFLLLVSITSLFFIKYKITHGVRPLIIATIAASLSVLCRYAGIVWIGLLAAGPWIWSSLNLRKRMAHSLVVLAGLIPPILWFLRNLMITDRLANRGMDLSPVGYEYFELWLITISRWFLPDFLNVYIASASLFILVLAVALKVFKLSLEPSERILFRILLLQIVSYLVFILFAMFYLSVVPVDYRILSPAYLLIVLFLSSAAPKVIRSSEIDSRLWNANTLLLAGAILIGTSLMGNLLSLGLTRQWILGGIGIVCAAAGITLRSDGNRRTVMVFLGLIVAMIFLTFFARRGIDFAFRNDPNPFTYGARRWQRSQVIRKIPSLDAKRVLYTNCVDVISLYTDRPVKTLPVVDERINSNLEVLTEQMKKQNPYIVLFNRTDSTLVYPDEKKIASYAPLQIVYKGGDGTIYELAK